MERLSATALATQLAAGGTLVDLREPPVFADAHVRGSLNVALASRSAPYWLNQVVSADERVFAVVAVLHDDAFAEALFDAAERRAVGVAAFDAGAFATAGLPIASFRTLAPDELAEGRERYTVVDVRETQEYTAGHVPGALWIPLGELRARAGEVPAGPVATICASGFRSATAASILEAAGRTDLASVWGGTTAWEQLGHPLARGRRP